jgi:mannitol-1-phosphate/altronate dehydrogenase
VKLQHDFLINSIRPQKRYEKWVKQDKESDEAIAIAAIQEYYHYSLPKAQAALSILTKEQIAIIKTKIDKGGIAK